MSGSKLRPRRGRHCRTGTGRRRRPEMVAGGEVWGGEWRSPSRCPGRRRGGDGVPLSTQAHLSAGLDSSVM